MATYWNLGLAVAAVLLALGQAPLAQGASPTCPYCTCEYNGPSFELHSMKKHPVTKDLQCQDWCKKHHPVLYTPASDCAWDYKTSTCYTTCAGCALPKGGCYQSQYSKCPTYTSSQACTTGRGGSKGCSCALKQGFDSCFPCYQCECTYTMGKVLLNVSDTHNVKATPEICERRCREHGKIAKGWWGTCTSTDKHGHLGCNTLGCDSNCTYITDVCTPRNQYCWYPYPGQTECSCPLTKSGVAPNCPTTTHPPVVPSAFAGEAIQLEEGGEAGELGELVLPEGANLPPRSGGKSDICPGN